MSLIIVIKYPFTEYKRWTPAHGIEQVPMRLA